MVSFFIVIANTAGDLFFYQLAKKYPSFVENSLRTKKITALERLKRFMNSSAGRTILVSHVGGTFAMVVSLLSGLAKVSWRKFLLFSLIGNLLMGFILLYLGFVLGLNWEKGSNIVNIASLVLTLGIGAILGYQALRK